MWFASLAIVIEVAFMTFIITVNYTKVFEVPDKESVALMVNE